MSDHTIGTREEWQTARGELAKLEAEHAQRIDTVLERVEAAIRSFRGRAEPLDDATLMALRIDA